MEISKSWVYKNLKPEEKIFSISLWKSVSYTILIYFAIFYIYLLVQGQHIIVKSLSLIVIGILIHHLMTLLHEGAHHLYFPNKKVNDFLIDLLIGLPLLTPVRSYRAFHISHHQRSGKSNDPERILYKSQGYFYQEFTIFKAFKMFLCDIFFINLFLSSRAMNTYLTKEKNIEFLRGLKKEEILSRLIFFTTFSSVIFLKPELISEILFYWLLPLTVIAFPILKQHAYGEHNGEVSSNDFLNTYSHEYSFIGRFIFYPINSAYHLEHHLFPKVPWYNLKKLRKSLIQNPSYKKESLKLTVDSHFLGSRSLMNKQILNNTSLESTQKSPQP